SYMLPQVRAGRLNGIGVASLKRTPLAPEIPTLDESGVPGFESTAWFGMWMPPQTPKTIVNRIHDVVVRSLNDSRPAIEKLGYKIGGETPDDFAQFVRAEVEKYGRVVKAAGIKPEG
ncbi:MAG: Bug family tripartite tricarboxylate transporter substrate binding protein, partial [Burkholderiales bacterium]